MTRRTSRRFANYSKQSDEQQFNGQPQQQWQQQSTSYDNKASDNDNVIADMAQGFMQAQAKMSDNTVNVNNLEIALLLQKCNNQLEEIRRSAQEKGNDNQVGEQTNKKSTIPNSSPQDNSQQPVGGMPPQDLQGLLASVFQSKNNNQNSPTNNAKMESNDVAKGSGGENQQKTVQTVSQVLAQAQYELANELENSLKKLKQVISESEKIANNISNLLGEETTKKS